MQENLETRLLSALLAVITGFLFSELANFLRRRRDEKRENRSIRRLLHLEQNRNRELLHTYWHTVKTSRLQRLGEQDLYGHAALGQAIIELPFPRMSREAWGSNLGKVARALNPTELQNAWNHYEVVQQLAEIRAHMAVLDQNIRNASRETERTSPTVALLERTIQFDAGAEHLVDRFQALIEQQLEALPPA